MPTGSRPASDPALGPREERQLDVAALASWRRRRFWKRIRRAIAFYVFMLPPLATISCMPLGLARALGWIVGTLAYYVAAAPRRQALENLGHAFGDTHGEPEIRAICRGCFRHFATLLADALVIGKWPLEKVEQRFGSLAEAGTLADPRPCGSVGVTAHFGNWELIGRFVNLYTPDLLIPVATKHSNQFLQRHIDRGRLLWAPKTLYTDDSPRDFIRAIRDGHCVGVLPDQDLKTPNGVFVPFFGRPAYTPSMPANLGRTMRAPVVVWFLVREGKGFKLIYTMDLGRPWTDDREGDIRGITEAYTRFLEDAIREYPEQWAWFHDRWNTKPGDEKRYELPRWQKKTRREQQIRGE